MNLIRHDENRGSRDDHHRAEHEAGTHAAAAESASSIGGTRVESDLIGSRSVPAKALWGIHTLRAQENFAITDEPVGACGELVVALAAVKLAAARANRELGILEQWRAEAIAAACAELMAGCWHEHFIVDLIQGGAGTSTNMNANEVIANRALDLLAQPRGSYGCVHPNDHVNLSQSTNDVYPTALRIALLSLSDALADAVLRLAVALELKASEFADVIKLGRTQLQDAVPMTLGQEFLAFSSALRADCRALTDSARGLREINLGGTAIGTGVAAPDGYTAIATEQLRELTGLSLASAPDLIAATVDVGAFVGLSGSLKRIAVNLAKIANDLRLLSSGPHGGLGELQLPAVQAGSSLMPGKVNPVIPEVVNQVAFTVIGHDLTVTMAAQAGQLQLNAFEPVIFQALRRALVHLTRASVTLADRCVAGITADGELLARRAAEGPFLMTMLSPAIGYEAASAIAKQSRDSSRPPAELVLERGLLGADELAGALQAAARPSRPRARPQAPRG